MNNQIQLVLKSSTTELSLNDHELGIYLTPELDGLTGLPEIRTTSGVNAGYDGGWTSAQNYDARSITIRGVIANEDVSTVEELRRQLTTLAGQGKNEELTLDLVTQAGKAYTIQVRTIALEMSLQKVLTQQEFMLQLRADDPLIYDASETGHEALLQVAQATGGFTIDFELPLAITGSSEETVVNNEGLEQVPTITRMYGALHNPKIINQTTNQFMQIEADLGFAEGDWIEPSEVVSGKDITINGAPEGAPLSSIQIDGETSQQTYSGKNLTPYPYYADSSYVARGITFTANSDGSVVLNGKNDGTANSAYMMFNNSSSPMQLEAGTYYFIPPSNTNVGFVMYDGKSYYDFDSGSNFSHTFSSAVSIRQIYIQVRKGNTTTLSNLKVFPMLTTLSGQTEADYEPYTGGAASPNPDYPQAVQTVTGENVVKISDGQGNEQSYEVNLGNIELCKIGDYQDSIYKSDGKWYVRKETSKANLATDRTSLDKIGSGTGFRGFTVSVNTGANVRTVDGSVVVPLFCNMLACTNRSTTYNTGSQNSISAGTASEYYKDFFFDPAPINGYSVADAETWLNNNPIIVYYPLATPTDTEITNAALLAQLEAILQEAKMYNPQTNITTLYAEGNEQGTLSISYFTDKNPDTRDELIIDSRLRTITLNGLDVYHLQAPGSEFLMLAPGENRLALQSDITGDNGYAQVSYKQGYLSI